MDMPWREAIEAVLREAGGAMHYRNIAKRIIESGLRTTVGATPGATVNAQISGSLKRDGKDCLYARVDRGTYTLREFIDGSPENGDLVPDVSDDESDEEQKLIHAFGMFWHRGLVNWTRTPSLLGVQQIGAESVSFGEQRGVYLLYDGREVIYVGRAIERPLGTRLYEHTQDRLRGRWDRFSWFGLYDVSEAGELVAGQTTFSLAVIGATLEALLIEGLEPRQNRRRGDGFTAVEYLQTEDPKVQEIQNRQLLTEMLGKLGHRH